MSKKDLKQLTELEFEKGVISLIRNYNSLINNVYELMNDVTLYKDKGYNIKYYMDTKKQTYNYIAYKPEVGFRGNAK